MMKLSEKVTRVDDTFEIYNAFIDVQNMRLRDEIVFVQNNYNNMKNLRQYFFCMGGFPPMHSATKYVNELNSYSLEKLQNMAECRVNVLYNQYIFNEKHKVSHSALKPVGEILNKLGL